jgi:hypothetical protein
MAGLVPAIHVLEHDPEKWEPVFGKDHAQTRNSGVIARHLEATTLWRS